MKAPVPPDESARLEALRRYEVLDTPPEQAFDDIALLAAQICGQPMAMVSLVDGDRQWFKSRVGVTAQETTRDVAFCAHTILNANEMLEVRDAEADPRFSESALVTSDPHVRFYAGAPLVSPDGHAIGALCVMGRAPDALTPDEQKAMQALSRHVVAQLELRKKTRELADEIASHHQADAKLREQYELLARSKEQADGLLDLADRSRRALLGVLEDEKQAAVNLRESEERFRQMAENIDEVFWLVDPAQGGILYVSPAYEKLWGRKCEELYASAEAWIEAIHPEDRGRVHDAWETVMTRNYDVQYRVVRPDGSVCWIHDRAYLVRDDSGAIRRIAGVARDITESKQANKRIAEQAALIDQTHDAILVRDLEGRILFWSKGAERLYGHTSADVLGKKASGILYDAAHIADYETAHATTISDGEWYGELQQVVNDGRKIIVEGSWTLVRDETGSPKSILAINTDITEKKKIEAQFLRAQRMESIGTLASGVAHDLNNILSPIMMAIEILKDLPDGVNRLTVLETIEASAKRGAEIVQQVLSFGRGMEGKRVEVQAKHLLKDVERIVRDTFPRDIRFRSSAATDVWTILGDPTQLYQVLLNLCVNARDAMPRGGDLTVEMKNRSLDEHYAAMNIQAKPGPHVLIEVTDSGTGIPKDVIDRIFDPFFTTKEVGKGTGLGLSTVLAIVKSHGGFVNVYSEPGKGTKFSVYIPALSSSSQLASDQMETASLPRGNGETVLLVDDEASILTITKQTLEAFGYKVLTADNGATAIAVYAQHMREVEVVLTDMMMPMMDGTATIHALKAIKPDIKIIAASGLNANGNMTKTSGSGVKHFLPKPYNARTLLETLRAILDEGK